MLMPAKRNVNQNNDLLPSRSASSEVSTEMSLLNVQQNDFVNAAQHLTDTKILPG